MNELETGWENMMPGYEGAWNPEVPRFFFSILFNSYGRILNHFFQTLSEIPFRSLIPSGLSSAIKAKVFAQFRADEKGRAGQPQIAGT